MAVEASRVACMLDLEWPYKRHTDVFSGAVQYANEHGWTAIIDEFADETLRRMTSRASCPYDGIIARVTPPLLEQARRWNLPLVNVWTSSPLCDLVPSVVPDSTGMGELCAEHFLSRGLESFATITACEDSVQARLRQAFMRVIREAGYECHEAVVPLYPQHSLDEWQETNRLIAECVDACPKPIGVYLSDEYLSRILLQTCRQRRLRIPADVAVIAGYNEGTVCEHLKPSLTALDLGYQKIGYEAARLLHRLMNGDPPPGHPIVVPSPGLVVRESTDFISVDNPTVAAALAFIAANSHLQIGQDDVAEAIDVETRTLQNYFRKHLGRPIAAEIRRVRIERAKRELASGKRTLKEIAHDVGFSSSMRMYDVFCREVGMRPSEYRERRRPEPKGE